MTITARPMVKSDARIRADIMSEIEWDPFIRDVPCKVAVENGAVTVTGQAPSLAARVSVVDAAHRVQGVLDVVDEMTVAPTPESLRSDVDVARAVRDCLQWDAYLPDERISCTVSAGTVTLRGSVDTWAQRGDAERTVQRLSGVRQLVNRLTVESKSVDPAAIRLQIERALERRAEREARRINVAVKDGVVTLSGSVQSWAERNAVERVAGSASGVTGIDDRIVVDPYS
jgi:osmotically-inducible protein OsmY